MWLVAAVLDGANIEHFHHGEKLLNDDMGRTNDK